MEEDQERESNCLSGVYRALKLDNPHQFVSAVQRIKSKLPKEPNAENTLYTILLHRACQKDAPKCAKILLDGAQCIMASSIHARNREGRTPLHTAAENHSINCIKLLLSRKARTDLQSFDNGNHLPLGSALMRPRMEGSFLNAPVNVLVSWTEYQDLEAIRLLLDATEELGQVAYKYAMEGCVSALAILVRVCGNKLMEPMDMVASYDGTKKVSSIYRSLVEAALQMVVDYALSLEDASAGHRNERIKSLLCQIQLLQQSKKFPTETSGTVASMMEYGQVLQKDITDALASDSTFKLISALKKFRQEALGWLGNESDALITLYQEDIPRRLLHLACQKDAVQCAKILLEGSQGIEASMVNARDQLTRTPLHVVAETHSRSIVELLLSWNACADFKLVDGKQLSALEIAVASKRFEAEWSVDASIQDFLLPIKAKGLDAVKLLAERTTETEIWQIAYRSAMEGGVTALAVLLLVAQQKTLAPVGVVVGGANIARSIYESVWDKILSIGDASVGDGDEKRKCLLFIIRLLNHFEAFEVNIEKVRSEGITTIKPSLENLIHKEEGSASHAIFADNASLLIVALERFIEKVLGLLKKEPDAMVMMNQQMSNRLLFLACEHDAVKCAKLLFSKDHRITAPQVLAWNQFGWSPLHVAAETHSVGCIDLILTQHEFKFADVSTPPVLEVALLSTRFRAGWPLSDSIEDFLLSLEEKGLEAVRVLAGKTSQEVLADMTCRYAINLRVTALAVLFMVVSEKMRPEKDDQEAKRAMYNCVLDALSTAGDSVPGGNEREQSLQQVHALLTHFVNSKWKNCASNSPAPPILSTQRELIGPTGVYDALKADNAYELECAVGNFKKKLPKERNAEKSLFINLLHRACRKDAWKCASALLKGQHGFMAPSVHGRDREGRTPLHTAAEYHSTKCIELLLSKKARTDLQLIAKGRHLPLGSALMSSRIEVPWAVDAPIESLLSLIKEQDLEAIRLLVDATEELGQVAYKYAMEGCVSALAILVRVCENKLMEPMDMVASYDGTKKVSSIYRSLVEAALQMVVDYALSLEDASAGHGKRIKPLLCQIQLLQQSKKIPTETSSTVASMMEYGQVLQKDITDALASDSTFKLISALKKFRQEALGWLGNESDALITLYQEDIPRRLLHLACQKDAVQCAKILLEGSQGIEASMVNARDQLTRTPLHVVAETHSRSIVELLLSWNARADFKLVDGKQLSALEIAVASKRFEAEWSVDASIQDFLLPIKAKGLDAVKLLAERTTETEIWQIAYRSAMEGGVTALAVLLLVAQQKTLAPVGVVVGGANIARSIYESVWDKILSIGDASVGDGDEKRKCLLFIIRLLNHFEAFEVNIEKVRSEGITTIKPSLENLIHKEEGSASHAIFADNASLLIVALERFIEKVLGLLKKEPDAMVMMNQQMSNRLLFLACEHDAVKCAKLLFSKDHRITAPQVLAWNQFGWLPLHVAAETHSVGCIDLILTQHEFKFADVSTPPVLEVALLSTRFRAGWPLSDSIEDFLLSLEEKGLEAVRVLADKTTQKVLVETAYRCATEGRVAALAMLLMLVKEKIWHAVKVEKDGQESQRALYNCVVDKILILGDSVPGGNGRKKHLLQVLHLLNYYGGSKWKDDARNSPAPLIQAAKAGDRDLLKIILSGQRDSRFNTICKAVMDNSVTTFRSLLEKFKSKMKNDLSKSAKAILFEEVATRLLHIACKKNAFDCAKIVLDSGFVITADLVNAVDYLGWTPLHFAAVDHCFSCISLLLSRKARTDIRSSEGLLALEVALTSDRFGNWSLDSPIEDLLLHLKKKGLVDAVKRLAAETKDVWNVARKYAMEGRVTALATLLLVVGDKISLPARVVEHGVVKMKRIFDLVVDEATSDHISNEKRKALRYVIKLFRAAEAGDIVLPVDGIHHEEQSIAPSRRAKNTRKMLSAYVAEHKDSFLVETILPDNNSCAELTPEGYQFINQLVRCFTVTYSSAKCWGKDFSWDNFEVVNDIIKILKIARVHLSESSVAMELKGLITFIKSLFESKNGLYIPYLDEFVDQLKKLEHRILLPRLRLTIEANPILMESYVRLVLMIMLRRKYLGANVEEKKKWDIVILKTQCPADWVNTFSAIPVFKDVIAEAERRESPYQACTSSFNRFMRDLPVHAPEHKFEKGSGLIIDIEKFKDDTVLELMFAFHAKDYVAKFLANLIADKVDIAQELCFAISCCKECNQKRSRLVLPLLVDGTQADGLSKVCQVNKIKRENRSARNKNDSKVQLEEAD